MSYTVSRAIGMIHEYLNGNANKLDLEIAVRMLESGIAVGWWTDEDIRDYEDYYDIELTDEDVERIAYNLEDSVLNNHETVADNIHWMIDEIIRERESK